MTAESKTDETLEEILARAGDMFERKFNKRILAQTLSEFIEEEEYTLDEIASDLETSGDSDLVHALGDELGTKTDKEFEIIFHVLRVLFNIEAEKQLSILEMNWNVSEVEVQTCRKYMAKQCPAIIKESEDSALLLIMAVGRKNNVHLLSLLYDTYTCYRVSHFHSVEQRLEDNKNNNNNNNNHNTYAEDEDEDDYADPKTTADFVQQMKVLAELKALLPNVDSHIKHSLKLFETRLVPSFKFNDPHFIHDDCNMYIEYTLMIAKLLDQFIQKNNCLPLQVDLIIVPKKVQYTSIESHFGLRASDDEEDSDDANDTPIDTADTLQFKSFAIALNDEESASTAKTPSASDSAALLASQQFNKTLKEILGDHKTPYTVDTIDNTQNVVRDTRKITEYIKLYVDGKHCRRVSVVIDRRVEPNILYVYSLPERFSNIPKDYCITTMINSAAQYTMPHRFSQQMIDCAKPPFVGGKHGNSGDIFQISFQCMESNRVRLHWFFLSGGIRMWPETMVTLWPRVFEHKEIDPKFTKQYVEEQFGLSFEDPLLDTWVSQINS